MEVKPPRKKTRHGIGKNNQIDATTAAIDVLGVFHQILPSSDS